MPFNKKISSLVNPSVKNVVRLRDRKERDKTDLTIVEGVREIQRALAAGISFQEIYVCWPFVDQRTFKPISLDIRKKNLTLVETPPEVFEKMSYGNRHEGLLGICRQPKNKLANLNLSGVPVLVVAEKVEKPGNLGAILRSCDAAGVSALIVCDGKTDIYNPNVIRSSLGTVFTVPVIPSSNQGAWDFLKQKKIKIFATQVKARTVYTQQDFCCPVAFVLGSERFGVSPFWLEHSDGQIRLPMKGAADSLNVSTTAAVLIYETLRQRST